MTSIELPGVAAGQDCGQGSWGTGGDVGPAAHPRHPCGSRAHCHPLPALPGADLSTGCQEAIHLPPGHQEPRAGGWRHHQCLTQRHGTAGMAVIPISQTGQAAALAPPHCWANGAYSALHSQLGLCVWSKAAATSAGCYCSGQAGPEILNPLNPDQPVQADCFCLRVLLCQPGQS